VKRRKRKGRARAMKKGREAGDFLEFLLSFFLFMHRNRSVSFGCG
jgi:hypothetical protein